MKRGTKPSLKLVGRHCRTDAVACAARTVYSNETLVSTASMAPVHFLGYGPAHIFDCLRPARVMQAAGHLLEAGRREELDGAQEHTIVHLLDLELGSWVPAVGVANGLGQDHLALGRKLGLLQRSFPGR